MHTTEIQHVFNIDNDFTSDFSLTEEREDGIDSSEEKTSAGSYVEGIAQQVENQMGLFLEISVQGGRGQIDLYLNDRDIGSYFSVFLTFYTTELITKILLFKIST